MTTGTKDEKQKRPGERISNEDYLTIQHQLVVFGGAIATIDLEAFLDRISQAEAAAPVIDPTAYVRAAPKMALFKALAESALVFQAAARAFQEEAKKLEARAG